MLTHIVIWKYRAEVEPEVRAEHVRRLQGLAALIKEVQSLAVGVDVLKLPRSFDTDWSLFLGSRRPRCLQRPSGTPQSCSVWPTPRRASGFG